MWIIKYQNPDLLVNDEVEVYHPTGGLPAAVLLLLLRPRVRNRLHIKD